MNKKQVEYIIAKYGIDNSRPLNTPTFVSDIPLLSLYFSKENAEDCSKVSVYSHKNYIWEGIIYSEKYGETKAKWEATPGNMFLGYKKDGRVSDPYTATGKALTLLKGYNDIKTCNKELAMAFDTEKNGCLPEDVLYAGTQKYWFDTENGPYYSSVINMLSGRKPRHMLYLEYPEIAAEYVFKEGRLKVEEITSNSYNKQEWECPKCKNRYMLSPVKRTNQGQGCPGCSGNNKKTYPEKAIVHYLTKAGIKANLELLNNGKYPDVSVEFNNKRIAIEYDGAQWHTEKERDIKKNRILKSSYDLVIRLREFGCPVLASSEEIKNISLPKEKTEYKIYDAAIKTSLSLLGFSKETISSLKINSKRNKSTITNEFAFTNNYLDTNYPNLKKYWIKEKNGDINLSCVDRSVYLRQDPNDENSKEVLILNFKSFLSRNKKRINELAPLAGKPLKVKVYSKELDMTFNSYREAAEFCEGTRIHSNYILDATCGRQKTAFGYTWERVS